MGTKADKSLQTVIEQPVHSHGCSNLCIVAIIGHITSPFIRTIQQIFKKSFLHKVLQILSSFEKKSLPVPYLVNLGSYDWKHLAQLIQQN